jgi:hypothetical protein
MTMGITADQLEEGVQTVYTRIKTLTDAQVKALPSTPIDIVPAPGAGKILWLQSFWMRMNWVADYTNIAATSFLFFKIGGVTTPLSLRQEVNSGVSGLLAGGGPDGVSAFQAGSFKAAAAYNAAGFAASSGFYDSDVMNLPITLVGVNTDGDFTGGDSGNSLIVTVNYSLLDFN